MKTFFKILLLLTFSFLSVIFLFLIFIKFNSFSTNEIKAGLQKANIYEGIVLEINKQIDKSIEDSSSDQSSQGMALIAPVIKQEVTTAYVQKKTEGIIDGSNDWITGKTTNPPVLSFADLKEKIIAQNQETVALLEQFSEEYNANKEEIRRQAIESGEMEPDQEMPDFDINKLMKSDFSIPLDKHLKPVKEFYQVQSKALPVIAFIMLALLAGIYFLSNTTPSGLKWLGSTFLTAAISNSILLGVLFLSSKGLLILLTKSEDVPAFAISLSDSLLPTLVEKYLKFGGIAVTIMVIIFITCLTFSTSLPGQEVKKTKLTPKPTKNK